MHDNLLLMLCLLFVVMVEKEINCWPTTIELMVFSVFVESKVCYNNREFNHIT